MSPVPAPRSEPLSGPFGKYQIIKKLGQGGMGTVYLAEDTKLSRQVALKVPLIGGEDDATEIARFQQAVLAVAPLRHPAICPIHEADVIDGLPYLTMAYIEGPTLAERLRCNPRLTFHEGAALIRRLAEALAEAHKHGTIHRDIKPSNVILDARGEPSLVDFGLARNLTWNTRLTRSRATMGTPAYMAPEQVRGEKAGVGFAADIYSLGVVLYELLCGKLPSRMPTSLWCSPASSMTNHRCRRPSILRGSIRGWKPSA